jgi:hypothetical protein
VKGGQVKPGADGGGAELIPTTRWYRLAVKNLALLALTVASGMVLLVLGLLGVLSYNWLYLIIAAVFVEVVIGWVAVIGVGVAARRSGISTVEPSYMSAMFRYFRDDLKAVVRFRRMPDSYS